MHERQDGVDALQMKRKVLVPFDRRGCPERMPIRILIKIPAYVSAFASVLFIVMIPALVLLFSSCGFSGQPGGSSVPAEHPTNPPHISPLGPGESSSTGSGIETNPVPEGQEASGAAISESVPSPIQSAATDAPETAPPVASPQVTASNTDSGSGGNPGTGSDPGSGNDPGPGSEPGMGNDPGTGGISSGAAEIIVRSDNILSSKEKEALLNDLDMQLKDLFGTIDKVSADPEVELSD